MSTTANTDSEAIRLAILKEYGLDSTNASTSLERLIKLTASVFDVPIVLVSLVEENRQLFAARIGIEVCETDRSASFCAHALNGPDILLVPDAKKDARFKDNPLVLGKPYIRFYAGCPLIVPSGHVLGTLCIIDTGPRTSFSEREASNLRILADLVLDKLELRRLELARQASQLRFEKLASLSPDAIVCTDDKARITFWNIAAERILGYRSDDVLGKNIEIFAPPDAVQQLLWVADNDASLADGRSVNVTLRGADGASIDAEVSASMWREGEHASFCAIIRDGTERRRNESRLLRLAHLDPLTELPNRALFRTRVESALRSDPDLPSSAVMVDLDGFKDVNDSLGHAGGDAVLIVAAQRITACIRSVDVVARMGGDEFALFLPGVGLAHRAGEIGNLIIESLSQPIYVEGEPVTIGASVGIAMFPSHGADVQELLSSADLALYEAKAQGKQCWRMFTPDLRTLAATRRAYQSEFARALENEEFELYYQPQINLGSGALVGAEALLRWKHPEKGILTPAAFMPALETNPLAPRIGSWAIKTACVQAADWRKQMPAFQIGVNVFSAQFRTGTFVESVLACLAESGLPPQALELEITERTILRGRDHILCSLRTLRTLGISIALDDYGTESTSLSTLKHFPLTRLKIDRSFVDGLLTSTTDAAIIRVILYLARSLGLAVTAEGVETDAQRARLLKKGCKQAQGYFFGKPVKAAQFSELYLQNR